MSGEAFGIRKEKTERGACGKKTKEKKKKVGVFNERE